MATRRAATRRGAASTATSIALYTGMLRWSMAHRWLIVTTCVLVVHRSFPLFRASGLNFTPVEDESRFQISAAAAGRLEPRGDAVAGRSRVGATSCSTLPGVLAVQGNAGLSGGGQGGNNSGNVFVRLKPIEERNVSQQELMIQARRLVQPYRKSAVISVQGTGGLTFAGGRGAQIQYALVGPDLAKLDRIHGARRAKPMDKSPALVDIDRSFQPGLPELRLDIDRQRAADLGVRVQDVSQTVNALIAGQDVTTFNAASDQYDVVLKAQDSFRRTPESIAAATVRTASGELVQLRNLVTVQRGLGPGADRSLEPAAPDHDLGKPGARGLAGRRARRRSKRRSPRSTWSRATTSSPAVSRASSAARRTTSPSRSRSRSSSCIWCWRRSSSRSSIRSPSC